MKKLNKLQINSERIMKNEELITLRGGYDGCSCFCLPSGLAMPIEGRDCSYECYIEFGGVGWCVN